MRQTACQIIVLLTVCVLVYSFLFWWNTFFLAWLAILYAVYKGCYEEGEWWHSVTLQHIRNNLSNCNLLFCFGPGFLKYSTPIFYSNIFTQVSHHPSFRHSVSQLITNVCLRMWQLFYAWCLSPWLPLYTYPLPEYCLTRLTWFYARSLLIHCSSRFFATQWNCSMSVFCCRVHIFPVEIGN